MARERQPEIHIDDLHPIEDGFVHAYWGTWKELGMIAHAHLDAINDNPRRGYRLDCGYRRESERGRMGQRQEELGAELVRNLRPHMETEMRAAGWQVVAKTNEGRDIWQHQPGAQLQSQSTPAQPVDLEQESGIAPGDQENDISAQSQTRIVYTRTITFICQWCRQEVTEQRFPSHTPLYCSKPACKKEATRVKSRERTAAWRKANPDARKKKKGN
jgi:hypothetical protein